MILPQLNNAIIIFIHLCIYLFMYLCIYLFIYLFIYLRIFTEDMNISHIFTR